MPESRKTIALVESIIEKARVRRGLVKMPESVNPSDALRAIRAIQSQKTDLQNSGFEIDQRELTRRVCEAQTFSTDEAENKILRYAYQVVAMNYFSHFGLLRVAEERLVRESFTALVQEGDGRDDHS